GDLRAGMERLFQPLPDPVGPQGARRMDEAASSQRRLEAVEAWTGALSGAAATRRGPGSRRTNGGKRSRSVAHRWLSGPELRAAERLSEFARPTESKWSTERCITNRTAVCGPARTVVWEGRSGNAPPYPDSEPKQALRLAEMSPRESPREQPLQEP